MFQETVLIDPRRVKYNIFVKNVWLFESHMVAKQLEIT